MNRSSTKEFFSSADPLSERWVDLRLMAAMRLALASWAFFITLIDPAVPKRVASPTLAGLALYTLYGMAIYLLSLRNSRIVTHKVLPWLDLFFYLLLITASNGTNSVFYYFFFFPIFVASFGWGLTAGLQLTLAAAVSFTIIGYLTAKPIELNRFLMRPVQLLVFGYMIARWGGYKIELKNRLQLLKDMTIFSNPRFGIDRTIKSILESLRAFYDADACLLIIPGRENDGSHYQLYRVTRETQLSGTPPRDLNGEAVGAFLFPSEDQAVIYRKNGRAQTLQFDLKTREIAAVNSAIDERVAGMLEASSYLSVPVQYQNQPRGRMYVVGGPHRFANSDMDFVVQLMDQVAPVMENIRLVDHLASDAAEQERRRLARDIHDSVIQPYLGLQFGVAAVRKKLEDGNPTVLNDVNELLELTTHEVAELRRYVGGLRAAEERRDVLLPAVERFAARFSSVTGIHVEVKARGKIEVNDRLAAELFQIVTEGLSNIRRHALSSEARVEMFHHDRMLVLQIKNRRTRTSGNFTSPNDGSADGNVTFNPRSISERAALLGGETKVSIDKNNYTVVSVRIPV